MISAERLQALTIIFFIFKRGIFTDELFKNETIEDPDYGIIEISRAKISYLYALFLEGAYRTLDLMFKPLDNVDENILARALIDYGKIEGTPEYVQHFIMPSSMKMRKLKLKTKIPQSCYPDSD